MIQAFRVAILVNATNAASKILIDDGKYKMTLNHAVDGSDMIFVSTLEGKLTNDTFKKDEIYVSQRLFLTSELTEIAKAWQDGPSFSTFYPIGMTIMLDTCRKINSSSISNGSACPWKEMPD